MLATIGDNKKGTDVSVKNQEHTPLTRKILGHIERKPLSSLMFFAGVSLFAYGTIMKKRLRGAKKPSAKKKKDLSNGE